MAAPSACSNAVPPVGLLLCDVMTGSDATENLTALPLREVLERLAAPTPAPGGGSAAALACSLAAALVEMATGLETGAGAGAADRGVQAARLRDRALELAEQDQRSYGPVLEALRRPADDAARPAELAAALGAAAAVPLAIAEVAADVARRAREATDAAGRHLLGDCATAALLAEAAGRAAALLVEINLHGTTDPRRDEAEHLARAATVDSQHALLKARRT
jgi:formiminotetrahydrofolate cyclodeaminase